MLDDSFERDRRDESPRERPHRASESGPISDREVPLAPVATSDVINRWLDGELAEPTNLRGDAARSVEFWRRVGEETDRRRHMVTPAHLSARIMAALPATPQLAQAAMAEPWWRKQVHLSPLTAIAAAAGLFVLGMLVMNAM